MSRSPVIRIVWAGCLAVGTTTHALTLLRYGWAWDYGGVPVWVARFWTSLVAVDPAVVALLFIRPAIGVWATVALMVADVSINVWVIASYGGTLWMVLTQAVFLLFVLATARLALPGKS